MVQRSTALLGSLIALTASTRADDCVESTKFVALDGQDGAQLGVSVATDGTLAVAGRPFDQDFGINSGAAYVFDLASGAQLHKLHASDAGAEDVFGRSIAVDGPWVIVGAAGNDEVANAAGAAYVFDSSTGLQTVKLTASDGAEAAFFGNSVGLSGSVAIVGASGDGENGEDAGAAYLFDVATGQELHKLLPDDPAPRDRFGWSVAIDGNLAAVGAVEDEDNGGGSGSAYVFDVSTGQQLVKLLASDGQPGDSFGYSVAIEGTTVVVGANFDDDHGLDSGSAYAFDAVTGAQLFKLLPDANSPSDHFGGSVGIDETAIVVGAPFDDQGGLLSGAAYVFDRIGGARLAKLLPSDVEFGVTFGVAVAIDEGHIVGGSPGDDEGGAFTGAAYRFDAASSIGTSYCGPAVPNSSGDAATIVALGSDTAGENCVTLLATGMATNRFGYFLNAMAPGFVQPPGSQGFLCLSGPIGRYSADVANTGGAGVFALHLDLEETPFGGGHVAVQPGETWYFQAWFRDANPGPTSNFTDGVVVPFQ